MVSYKSILLLTTISINEITSFQTKPNLLPHTIKSHTALQADKKRGIYSRPSAAIERGSGFFVPGLEGGRVRIVFGIVLLLANVLNDTNGTPHAIGFTEWISIVFSVIIILQGVLEGQEDAMEEPTSEERMEVIQNSKPTLPPELISQLRWVGLNIFSFTSTTKFLVWDNTDSFCFTLSSSKVNDPDPNVIQAARQSLKNSQSGTISVPNSHPMGYVLDGNGGIILQRVGEEWGRGVDGEVSGEEGR